MADKKLKNRGATIKRAIDRMDGADLILLAKEMSDAFSYLSGPDWSKDLGGFLATAKPALHRAFKVTPTNGQGKASLKAKAPLAGVSFIPAEPGEKPLPFMVDE